MSLLPLTIPVPTPLIRTIPLLRLSVPGPAIAQSDERLVNLGRRMLRISTPPPILGAMAPGSGDGAPEISKCGSAVLLPCWPKSNSAGRGRRGCCCLLDASEGRADRVNWAAWQSRDELAATQSSHLLSCFCMAHQNSDVRTERVSRR
jgi:hypothetical protein